MDKEGGGGEGREGGWRGAHSEQLKKRGGWEEVGGRGGPNMTCMSVC